MDASEGGAGKKAKRQWKKIDPGQILDIQSYEEVRKGSEMKGKGKNEKGKGKGKGEDGEGKGKGKGGGKNYNRLETSDASPSAEAAPPETPAPPAESGEQRPPYQQGGGGKSKGGGKAKGRGFDRGDNASFGSSWRREGKGGGKGRGRKGGGFHQQAGTFIQGAAPAPGAEAAAPAPSAEEPRPPPPPQAPAAGNAFPGMPGGYVQQPMAGCMACPAMPFFDMSQMAMYSPYVQGCMPYHMPYSPDGSMMGGPCMQSPAAPPNPEQRTDQVNKAKQQIDYYFSEENLIKDVFLRQNIMDTQGWVSVSRLADFPKLSFSRNDQSILVDAIMQNSTLELKTDHSAVRLKNSWQRWVLQRGP